MHQVSPSSTSTLIRSSVAPINYGIYHCLNVVCQPEAVLIRAVEPLLVFQPSVIGELRTAWAGSGRLARSLGVRKENYNGIAKGADFPWRFSATDSKRVSRR